MHYFKTLVTHYRKILGPTKMHLFKPTAPMEKWYGFDQGYFKANVPKPEAIRDLRAYIQSGKTPTFTSFRAFLLQFKVVEKVMKRSPLSPHGWSAPYYRSELDLKPNPETGISQHETLRLLAPLSGASVSYVCPMIFDEDDTLKRALFSQLRFVDVASSPTGWITTQRHFIAFKGPTDTPNWCSQPIEAEELNWKSIIESAPPLNSDELFTLLDSIRAIMRKRSPNNEPRAQSLPRCLTIVGEIK